MTIIFVIMMVTQCTGKKPEDSGFTTRIQRNRDDVIIDKSWVILYNPVQSRMFNAHINVESCQSVKAICKYANKGIDQAVFGLNQSHQTDEISIFQMCQYI